MSAKGEGEQPVMSRGYNAGGLVAYPRPDEIVVPLRREEFETLCEGGVGEEKSNRDLYIGGFIGSLAGLVGVLATTDWETIWKPERRWLFLLPLIVLCIMVAVSVAGGCIHQLRLIRTMSNSPFSRLRARLLGLFNEARTPSVMEQKLPGAVVGQISTLPSVKWERVANLFWAGHDLAWTEHTVRSTAPKKRILHGLIQSYHHLSEMGLADSGPGELLLSLKVQADSTAEVGLDQQWRNAYAGRVSQVIQGVGEIARSVQPGFRPNP